MPVAGGESSWPVTTTHQSGRILAGRALPATSGGGRAGDRGLGRRWGGARERGGEAAAGGPGSGRQAGDVGAVSLRVGPSESGSPTRAVRARVCVCVCPMVCGLQPSQACPLVARHVSTVHARDGHSHLSRNTHA